MRKINHYRLKAVGFRVVRLRRNRMTCVITAIAHGNGRKIWERHIHTKMSSR